MAGLTLSSHVGVRISKTNTRSLGLSSQLDSSYAYGLKVSWQGLGTQRVSPFS